jgi:S-adenosylmethionine:tRNA ribosyltransferase-isomerase
MEVPDYHLPESAIAQTPAEPRDSARILDASDPTGQVVHRTVRQLPEILRPDDVLVVNSSRVVPARLRLFKPTGGAAEVLLLEPERSDPRVWTALVRPGRRLPPGTRLAPAPERPAVLEVGERLDEGRRRIKLLGDAATVMADTGAVALPPYINTPLADPERYQTVYADQPGSVAAPTAGLHLTLDILDRCRARGIEVHMVDLAVGMATFRPVRSASAEDHVMHTEHYLVPPGTWKACQQAARVVAVGTTTVRALESAATTGRLEGQSDLYIRGEFQFQVVDVLLTNFHLPRSTLLLLLEAFCGERWRDLYSMALDDKYRFLSFGDAMLVGRRPVRAEEVGGKDPGRG